MRRRPWQVEDLTPASRISIALGRFASAVAVLLAALAALTIAGCVLALFRASGRADPSAVARGLWLVAAPSLLLLAALRTLFDGRPWLRGAWGDVVFFLLWIASLIIPLSVAGMPSTFETNILDFPGFSRPLLGPAPSANTQIAIGGVKTLPGPVALNVDAGLTAPG